VDLLTFGPSPRQDLRSPQGALPAARLSGHIGQEFGIKDGTAVLVPGTGQPISRADRRLSMHHEEPLAELLDPTDMDHVLDGLPRSVAKQLEELTARTNSIELETIIAQIENKNKAEFVKAVFSLLLVGNCDGAQKHVELSQGIIKTFDECDEAEMVEVRDGEDVRHLRIGSSEYAAWVAAFEKRSLWYEWFLFLHPEQEKVVRADFSGVAQLSGVSGSGKTCVAVRRALRLAETPNANVLLLTLNRSLAGLLNQLVDAACNDTAVRGRIKVASFFERI
jgi:hypothetical protein